MRSGETRPGTAPGARTSVMLSGASGPVIQAARSSTAAKVDSPSPAGSRKTMSVGVPRAGNSSRASSYASVDSASPGRNSAASFSRTSSRPRKLREQHARGEHPDEQRHPLAARAADEVGEGPEHGLHGLGWGDRGHHQRHRRRRAQVRAPRRSRECWIEATGGPARGERCATRAGGEHVRPPPARGRPVGATLPERPPRTGHCGPPANGGPSVPGDRMEATCNRTARP